MGAFDWLFGKTEEDKPPETLVFGAKLRCDYGKIDTNLWVETNTLAINSLPNATVINCIMDTNIPPFGFCTGIDGECMFAMELAETWINPEVQNEKISGEEIITMNSYLMCNRAGGKILPLDSGQNGEFATMILYMMEMDKQYPGLREILQDPTASIYLNEGMREMAIKFMNDKLAERGGELDIPSLDPNKNIEDFYINNIIGSLANFVDISETAHRAYGLDNAIIMTGLNNGANCITLDSNLMKVLEATSLSTQKDVDSMGIHKWMEENKWFTVPMGAQMMQAANTMILFTSMEVERSKIQPEYSNRPYRENIEQNSQEPLENTSTGGRLGNAETRAQNREIADYLRDNGYEITGGGGYAKEEYLPGSGGGRAGSNYVDITAAKAGQSIRINTVDTYANGAPTIREANAATSINGKIGGGLVLIPKGTGLGNLPSNPSISTGSISGSPYGPVAPSLPPSYPFVYNPHILDSYKTSSTETYFLDTEDEEEEN